MQESEYKKADVPKSEAISGNEHNKDKVAHGCDQGCWGGVGASMGRQRRHPKGGDISAEIWMVQSSQP